MTGAELKSILARNGLQQKDIADMLNMSQQNLSNSLKIKDVTTGLLEQHCEILNVDITFFYRDTKYLQDNNAMNSNNQPIASDLMVAPMSTFKKDAENISALSTHPECYTNGKTSNILLNLSESVTALTHQLKISGEQKNQLIKIIDRLTNQ